MKQKQTFQWQTKDGGILTLDQMSTRHIFNCMKMLYNHLAMTIGLEGVWFKQKYDDQLMHAIVSPSKVMNTIVIFVHEIEVRGDLPFFYKEPYEQIVVALCKTYGITVDRLGYDHQWRYWGL